MMIRNRISLLVATFLIIGFFFLALPEKGLGQSFCCQIDEAECFDLGDGLFCPINDVVDDAFCNEAGQCIVGPPPTDVPTLSEWGLIAMAGILGIVGFMVIRRGAVVNS